jgi:hypothetical protein
MSRPTTAPGLEWWVSNWDHQVHAFRKRGEIASEAICSHTALTAKLTEPGDSSKPCVACLLVHGNELADDHGDAAYWVIDERGPTRPRNGQTNDKR